jgi:hypothetical protein
VSSWRRVSKRMPTQRRASDAFPSNRPTASGRSQSRKNRRWAVPMRRPACIRRKRAARSLSRPRDRRPAQRGRALEGPVTEPASGPDRSEPLRLEGSLSRKAGIGHDLWSDRRSRPKLHEAIGGEWRLVASRTSGEVIVPRRLVVPPRSLGPSPRPPARCANGLAVRVPRRDLRVEVAPRKSS